jgi:hypothetical protein
MLELLISLTAGAIGFILSRNFVRGRLRFVDAVRSPVAPFIAGIGAAMVAWPAALLPFVTLTTTILFGIGTGLGTASGVRALKRLEGIRRRLSP